MKQTLMGNEAIAWGIIHSNIQIVSGYPGTPSSEILTTVQKIKQNHNLDMYAKWATNEKVGFEVAYSGAISGQRACATMKQVGLNVASDALMSASYIGNKGAMLLISADDPGFYSSQTEQDSRVFAKFARIPVLDPSTPQDAYDFVRLGVKISELFETIVMLRPVMRVSHAREIIEMDNETNFTKTDNHFKREISRWAAVPREGRLSQGIEQIKRIKKISEYNWTNFIAKEFEKCKKSPNIILASGTAYGFAKETLEDLNLDINVVKIIMPYPLPADKIKKELKKYEKVLILEETYPCVEEQLACENVYGKLTNTVHEIDEMTKERVLKALKNIGFYKGKNIYEAPNIDLGIEIPARPPALCPGCPHRDIFYAIMKVFKKNKTIYPSDIGCYTLGLSQGAIDSILCMGASVSMASGFSIANPDKTVVATIGDGTFFHSGIPPLINAVYQKHKFILVILDNSVIAMTGRQKTPENSSQQIDIKKIVEGMGIECLEHHYSHHMQENIDFFKIKVKEKYKNNEGPTVVVIRQFCVLDNPEAKKWIPNTFATVDENKCVACDQCTTVYKCPPMHYNEKGKIEIDPFLCIGCGGCLEVICPTDAFKKRED